MTIESLIPSLRPPSLGAPGMLAAIGRTNAALSRVQIQLALGQAMLSASDDPARSSALARLSASLEESLRRADLLGRGVQLLEATDPSLSTALDAIGKAKSLAASDAILSLPQSERDALADEINQIIDQLVNSSNVKFDGVHLFGGTRPGFEPFSRRTTGVLYTGRGGGLDIGLGEAVTVSGHRAFGAVSRRIDLVGSVNLSQGLETPISAWGAGALGSILVEAGGQKQVVDLSGVATLRDLKNALEGLDLGVRVEFDVASGKAWIRNALSGASMSISDLAGDSTASNLGIDTFASYTLLSDFNDGAGVRFAVPNIDPQTGEPATLSGADFFIQLHDGRSFNVDLDREITVAEVLVTINSAAAAAGITPAEFTASLQTGGNGFQMVDTTAGISSFGAFSINGSWAAEDLGILTSTTGAVIAGKDRAQVAVDGAFTHLFRLRDAILSADPRGMALAIEGLGRATDRVSLARSGAGATATRLSTERATAEEFMIQQESLRTLLRDVDVAEAASRMSALSTQLQAGLMALSRVGELSLIRFLR